MHPRIRLFLSHRLPAIAWTIFIFILLSLPGKMLPDENQLSIPGIDKLVHISLFGFFVFLWSLYYAFKQKRAGYSYRRYLIIAVVACIYGTAMEYVQKYFIPNRDFDLYDILADIIGAAAGYFVVYSIVRRWNNYKLK